MHGMPENTGQVVFTEGLRFIRDSTQYYILECCILLHDSDPVFLMPFIEP